MTGHSVLNICVSGLIHSAMHPSNSKGRVIDHEAILDVAIEHALVCFIDLIRANHFNIRDDVVLGTEIQHFLTSSARDAITVRAAEISSSTALAPKVLR